ncbi:MAG: DUF3137 domain-containing protein [Parvibaculum sp.]|nr:DUF3137 domain-containing protein [Parvibaculum sp.]
MARYPRTLSGFETFLAEELAPWARERDRERRRIFYRSLRRAVQPILGAILLFAASVVLKSPLVSLVAMLGVPALAIWAIFRFAPSLFSDEEFESELLEGVYGFFGLSRVTPPRGGFLDMFYSLALTPGGAVYKLHFNAEGTLQGIACEILQATQQKPRGKNAGRGVLFVTFVYPKAFSGVTSILPDRGSAVNLVRARPYAEGENVARVRLEDAAFEAAFEVFSTDQTSARYLLTPSFMERLLHLHRRLGHETRAAFADGKLYVLFGGEQPYGTGRFDVESGWEDLRALGADILRVSDLVEVLALDAETRV